MIDFKSPELEFAVKAVREASALARQVQNEMTAGEMTKGDRSPVTVADFALQALIGRRLEEQFPADSLVAEESTDALREKGGESVSRQVLNFFRRVVPDASEEKIYGWIDRGNGKPKGRFWTLDPIDGTKGFLRGDQYAVCLALIENGRVQLGVLGCPNLGMNNEAERNGDGSLFFARRGQGAWRAPLFEKDMQDIRRIHVSKQADPAKACILRSVEASHTNPGRTEEFLKRFGIKAPPRFMDSQAKHAVLASGGGDIFFYLVPKKNPDFRMKIWDVTAGSLLIEEAGGKITDLEGKDLDFTAGDTIANNPGILVTNGHLHDFALRTLREVC